MTSTTHTRASAMRLSPEQLRRNGRKYLTRTDDDDHDLKDFFTNSLPSGISMAELAKKRPSMPQTSFHRSFTLSSNSQRSRSSSVHIAGNALKRSLRLPRSRPGRPSSAGTGNRGSLRLPHIHRRKSNNEPAPTPESLDNAFEKIKQQLVSYSCRDY